MKHKDNARASWWQSGNGQKTRRARKSTPRASLAATHVMETRARHQSNDVTPEVKEDMPQGNPQTRDEVWDRLQAGLKGCRKGLGDVCELSQHSVELITSAVRQLAIPSGRLPPIVVAMRKPKFSASQDNHNDGPEPYHNQVLALSKHGGICQPRFVAHR
jgi:hypothetical protein